MISILIISLLLQPVSQQGEDSSALFGVLLKGSGSADLRQGLSTLQADTLTAFPQASYTDRMFSLEACAAVESTSDSSETEFRPVSAGAFFRWPGSPWISTGVFRNLRDPFIQGLKNPVCEWNSTGVSEESGVTAEAGGILGFDGFWNQYGDTLSWYGVDSPWLGFGMLSWTTLERDSARLESVGGFLDLRTLQPWFSLHGVDEVWSGECEIRGWKPVKTTELTFEVVPGAEWSSDSTVIELKGYLRGRTRSFSGYLLSRANTESPEDATIEAGFDMLSRAGIEWSVTASLDEMENFSGNLSGWYRASPAGCGGMLSIEGDSLAFTSSALYSPVRGVSSVLSVTTDLSTGSPDPRCSFGVFGAGRLGTARVTVNWQNGVTELNLGVSAWID